MYNKLFELLKFELPSWDNLPKEPMMMDKMLEYLTELLAPLNQVGDGEITKTMINNYVKWNIVPKPDGRKYEKKQISILIAILIFKPILSITEIAEGILVLEKSMDLKTAYNKLATSFNRIKVEILEPIVNGDEEFHFTDFKWQKENLAINSSITSLVLLITTKIIISIGGIINDKNSIYM